jgi:hypothetical protein
VDGEERAVPGIGVAQALEAAADTEAGRAAEAVTAAGPAAARADTEAGRAAADTVAGPDPAAARAAIVATAAVRAPVAGTAATQAPVAGTAATQAPVAGTAATQAPVAGRIALDRAALAVGSALAGPAATRPAATAPSDHSVRPGAGPRPVAHSSEVGRREALADGPDRGRRFVASDPTPVLPGVRLATTTLAPLNPMIGHGTVLLNRGQEDSATAETARDRAGRVVGRARAASARRGRAFDLPRNQTMPGSAIPNRRRIGAPTNGSIAILDRPARDGRRSATGRLQIGRGETRRRDRPTRTGRGSRRRTCSLMAKSSSPGGARSRRRSLLIGRPGACSSFRSDARRSNDWSSMRLRSGSRSSRSRVGP